ncbi:MAG: hypothetical protein NC307_11325 [Roseburia sp.]|nr:hypothetical protein [Roseburia sp.]
MDRAGNQKLSGMDINIPVAESTTINEATMVAVNEDGYAVPASKTEGLIVAGCAMRFTDNASGIAGAVSVPVRRGVFVWNNDGTIQETDILKDAYVSDEKTVTITAKDSSRAGKILAVDSDGVTVEML